jgi:FtsP/CotA-like multicopper oxidase with cupredoxin domain
MGAQDMKKRVSPKEDAALGMGSWVFALLAVLLSFGALIVAGQAFGKSNDAQSSADKANGVSVSLSEFAITPSSISAPVDGTLTIHNNGTVQHNFAIKGTDKKTSMLSPGSSTLLDLSGLKAGNYVVYCQVAGHEGSGMKGTLTIGGTAGSSMGGMDMSTGTVADAGVNTEANDMMDAQMAVNTKAFPAKTEGLGAQPLQPKVLADGTKEFDLTAQVVQWEVSPGKKVEAWTYNGVVPGPTIRVNSGDKVAIKLKNELPESTTIHFHGITVPNSMDGVPDITQPPIKPGETYTYSFTAQGPAVGMYHSHDHAEKQVPDGLFAPFLIDDVPMPNGIVPTQRIPMVLNDAGTIGLTLNGKSFPATAPIVANYGEWVQIDYFNEGLLGHPMHLHGMPQLVVGKDGFAVPAPYQADTIWVGPGERYSVLVHADQVGTWAFHCHILTHAESESGMFGMVTAFVVKPPA